LEREGECGEECLAAAAAWRARPRGFGRSRKSHPSRLKQEAPEEENAYDEGERDDDNLDERHGQFLRGVCAAPCSGLTFYRRPERRVNVGFLWVESDSLCPFPLKIRAKTGAGSVIRGLRARARRGRQSGLPASSKAGVVL
jgi:hypothetical protein